MTTFQMGLTIAVCTAATMLTRFLPFLIFSSKDQQPPEVVQYLGRVLPAAIFGMLDPLLPEKRHTLCGQSRHPRGHCHCCDHRPAPVEAPDTGLHHRRYGVLCAVGAAGVRITETGGAGGASPVCFNDRMYQN